MTMLIDIQVGQIAMAQAGWRTTAAGNLVLQSGGNGKVSFASRSVVRGSKGFRRTLAEQGVGVHEIIQGASQSATSRYRQKAFAN